MDARGILRRYSFDGIDDFVWWRADDNQEFIALPPRVKLWDIVLLMIGASITEIAFVVLLGVFGASRFFDGTLRPTYMKPSRIAGSAQMPLDKYVPHMRRFVA